MAELEAESTTETPYIIGETKAIFFENKENFYKVMLIEVHETNTTYDEDEIVITGNFGQIKEALPYKFIGSLVSHPKYGLQFKSDRYEQIHPSSKDALVKFLSGPQFTGIGQVTATNIIEKLGKDAVEKILTDPKILENIRGLTKKKSANLVDVLRKERGLDLVIITLNKYGIGNKLAYSIYQKYEDETLEVIQKNPYQLVEDIQNIGFQRADTIAEEIGIEADSPERIRAAILQSLSNQSLQNGDTYCSAKDLMSESRKLLESSRPFLISNELLEEQLNEAVEEKMFVKDGDRYYLPSLFAAEWGIVSSVERIQSHDKINNMPSDKAINKALKTFEKNSGICYGESQKEAIRAALQSPMFILTGGPGTGKTTVVNAIVNLYTELHDLSLDPYSYKDEPFPIVLAAPTGRAAKRMNETTNLPSGTIHRLLGLTGHEDHSMDEIGVNIKGELLIIDEMSMVDTWLFNQLLSAVPSDMQVILIGDKDQLPSVGPGQVFHDLIRSDEIETMELTEIYRQEDGSSITYLAHNIKNGFLPDDFTTNQDDRSFIPCQTNQIVPVISQVVARAVEKGFTASDIQVLAPMYRGQAGIDNINKSLQEVINSNDDGTKKEVTHFETVFRIGDKVLQLVNEAERNVFNGDLGIIIGITYAKDHPNNTEEITILFDETEVNYTKNEWNKFTLAYCMSIHKAQGSEFKVVILPFVRSYYRMLKRDLLYTAITRASDWLILCGEKGAYEFALENTSANRQTTLANRLTADIEDIEEAFELSEDMQDATASNILTGEMVEKELVSPMIGMKDITPVDI